MLYENAWRDGCIRSNSLLLERLLLEDLTGTLEDLKVLYGGEQARIDDNFYTYFYQRLFNRIMTRKDQNPYNKLDNRYLNRFIRAFEGIFYKAASVTDIVSDHKKYHKKQYVTIRWEQIMLVSRDTFKGLTIDALVNASECDRFVITEDIRFVYKLGEHLLPGKTLEIVTSDGGRELIESEAGLPNLCIKRTELDIGEINRLF